MALEIERKFLCTLTREQAISLSYSSRRIESIYMINNTINSFRVVKDTYLNGRVDCKWTKKSNTGTGDLLVRNEIEEFLPIEIFEVIQSTQYPKVLKERFLIKNNGNIWEVDFFDDYDFVIAELEFDNVESANNFSDFPNWVTLEVTHNPYYLNCNLSK